MPNWNNMTPEEREQYINQDACPGRERLACFPEDCDGEGGFARFFQGMGYIPENSPLRQALDPLVLECLLLRYCEGKSYAQIAKSVSLAVQVEGRTIKTRALTRNMVGKLLTQGRRKLQRICKKEI